MSEQMYAEPIPYWVAENTTQLDRLREQVKEAEAAATKETDWTAKTRAAQDAQSVRRALESAELAATQEVQVVARQEGLSGYIRNRNGDYLYVRNSAARADTPEPREEFMPIATNTGKKSGGVQWPEAFSERTALMQAAVAELRQAGIA